MSYLIQVGDYNSTDFDRCELYVDARDIQQEEGETVASYKDRLTSRAIEKLLEHKSFISLEGTIVEGTTAFRIGTDFNVGDFVSFKLDMLNLIADVQIKKMIKSYCDNREYIDLVFGFEKASIRKILRKGGL